MRTAILFSAIIISKNINPNQEFSLVIMGLVIVFTFADISEFINNLKD